MSKGAAGKVGGASGRARRMEIARASERGRGRERALVLRYGASRAFLGTARAISGMAILFSNARRAR